MIDKTVYNNYNRGAGAFDALRLPRINDSASPEEATKTRTEIAMIMTRAHTDIYSLAFLQCKEAKRESRFCYPIGTSDEHNLLDALVQALHTKLSTLGKTKDDKKAYAYLLQLIHLTLSHLWFLRCPDGYDECRRKWADSKYEITIPPHFHKIGLEFVHDDGTVRVGHERSSSQTPRDAFDSIKNDDDLKLNVIKALIIAEDGWKNGLFGWKNGALDIASGLEKSGYTQKVYNMLNDTLYALLVYGLSSLAPDKNPITTYNRYKTELNPLLTDGIIHTTTKLLSQTISEVEECRPISEDVKKIIAMRNDPVKKPSIPSADIFLQPLLEEQTREETMLNIDEDDAIEALLMLGQKRKSSEFLDQPIEKRQRTSSTEFLNTAVPPLPLPTPIASSYPSSPLSNTIPSSPLNSGITIPSTIDTPCMLSLLDHIIASSPLNSGITIPSTIDTPYMLSLLDRIIASHIGRITNISSFLDSEHTSDD